MPPEEKPSEEQIKSALRDILGEDRGAIIESAKLLSYARSTTQELAAMLASEHRPENRQGILYALSWHANLGTWNLMVAILANPNEDPKVRGQAAEGLAYMFDYLRPESDEFRAGTLALLDALRDPSPEIRYCAVHALGATAFPPLIPAISQMLADKIPAPGWIGTVADEAGRALEHLQGKYRHRMQCSDPQPEPTDFQKLEHLEQQILAGTVTVPREEIHALVRRVGLKTNFDSEIIEAALVDLEKTKAFVALIRKKFKRSSRRYGEALIEADRLATEGKLEEARQLMEALASSEEIPFFAELARDSLSNLIETNR